MPVEQHIDDQPLTFGTHKRGASFTLNDPKKAFLSNGVMVDMLVKNTTDGSEGTITAVTEHTVSATLSGGANNSWETNDEYEIYLTGEEDSFISKCYTDASRGWQVFYPEELDPVTEYLLEDVDLDYEDEWIVDNGDEVVWHGGHTSYDRGRTRW